MDECINCKFFMPLQIDGDQGICRRYPPLVMQGKDEIIYSQFPIMLINGWCGEYKNESACN